MKLSHYTIVVDVSHGVVLYNTMYKNIAELDEGKSKLFKNLKINNFKVSSDEDLELVSFLSEQMFIIEDGMDELSHFKLEWNRSLYSSGFIRHTILPNLTCNCDCPYCFENKTDAFMDKFTEQAYLSWLEPQLSDAKHLYITWYGGEPLLSKGTIERITNNILNLEKTYEFKLSSSLVTNGILLDAEFIHKAEQLRIKSVQVTLDGDKPIHDKYRYIKGNGKGTFDTIMSNMDLFCQTMHSDVASILRINVTDENYSSISSLLSKIPHAIKENCVLLFRWVYSHTEGRSPGKEFSKNLKGESPFTNLIPLYKMADELGFTTSTLDEGITFNFCECDFDKAFLIDQDGNLFMCSHGMGKDESVGNVRNGFNNQSDYTRYAKFITVSPFEDRDCLLCKILPICKGGCRKARYIGKRVCSDVRYDLDGYVLQKYHKSLKEGGK